MLMPSKTKPMRTENLLRLLTSFHPLPAAFKEALDREMQPVTYPKNHFLVQVHSIAHHAYFLEKGFAVAFYFKENRKIVTTFFKPGEIILSPKSFFEQSHSEEAIQLTIDSELLYISHSAVNKLFDEFPVANFLSRAITANYHSRSEQRIVDLHDLSAWDRYIKLLGNFPGIELNASQDLIASYLNITPQSLSRLRHEKNQT